MSKASAAKKTGMGSGKSPVKTGRAREGHCHSIATMGLQFQAHLFFGAGIRPITFGRAACRTLRTSGHEST